MTISSHGVLREEGSQGAWERRCEGVRLPGTHGGSSRGRAGAWCAGGGFTPCAWWGLFSTWSNTITSLFSSYRRSSECQPQRVPEIQPKHSRPNSAGRLGRKSRCTASSCWAGGLWAALWVHIGLDIRDTHPYRFFSFFLKKHYLSSIFPFDRVQGLESQLCCLLTVRPWSSPTNVLSLRSFIHKVGITIEPVFMAHVTMKRECTLSM